jgi:MFS family permease
MLSETATERGVMAAVEGARQLRPVPAGTDDAAPPRRLRTFAALGVRDYRVMWLGMLAAFTAMQMQMIAQGYLAYALTGSATVLGLVGMASGLPQLLLGLLGGVVADRVPKRRLLAVTQSTTGLLALITAVLVGTGWIEVWHLFVLGAAQGTVFAFNMPARQAFIPQIVGEAHLMNAIALNNAGMNFTRIFGPALAGLLIATPLVGLAGVFFLIAACYVWVVLSTVRISVPGAPMPRSGGSSPLADLRDGVRYVGSDGTLLMLLVLSFVVTCLGMPYQTFLPVFAGEKVLNIGAAGLGLLSTAVGVGALAGSLVVATLAGMRRRALVQLIMGAGFGVSLVAFGLTRVPAVALLVLVFVGLTANFFMSLNNTMLMARAEPRYYGRVMSVYMLSWSAMPLASVPLGRSADVIGAPATVALAGAVIALVVGGIALFAPRYRRAETDLAAPTG